MGEEISDLNKFIFVNELDSFVYTIPAVIEGDFKKEFLKEYESSKKELGDLPFLDVFIEDSGTLGGSNVPSLILANQILNKYGLRTIGFKELDKVRISNKFDLNKYSVDLGFLIMSYGNPNEDISKSFCEGVIKKNYRVGEEPILIYPWEIEIKKDSKKLCGLDFKLKEESNPRYFKTMGFKNDGKSIQSIDEDKFNFNNNGRLKFLASFSGLTRITLENNTYLRANRAKLNFSNHFYRMILTQK